MLYSEYYVKSSNNQEPSLIDKDWPLKIPNKHYQFLGLVNSNYIIPQAMVIHKSVYDEIGYYEEQFDSAAEYHQTLKMHTKFESKFIKCGGCAGDLPNSPDWKKDQILLDEYKISLNEFLNEHTIDELFPIANLSDPNVVKEILGFTKIVASNNKSLIDNVALSDKLVKLVEDWFFKKVKSLKSLKDHSLEATVSLSDNIFLHRKNSISKELEFVERNSQNNKANSTSQRKGQNENSKQICVNRKSKLSSIVVLSYNSKKYLEECLNSIIQYTQPPYEIVVVDNDSDEETVEYLKEFKKKVKNTQVIFNTNNLGFPSGINQGILHARGENIVVANNDIVVTEKWLERMIAASESDSKIGIVGPLSNSVSGVQLDPDAKYPSIKEMHKYAKKMAGGSFSS